MGPTAVFLEPLPYDQKADIGFEQACFFQKGGGAASPLGIIFTLSVGKLFFLTPCLITWWPTSVFWTQNPAPRWAAKSHGVVTRPGGGKWAFTSPPGHLLPPVLKGFLYLVLGFRVADLAIYLPQGVILEGFGGHFGVDFRPSIGPQVSPKESLLHHQVGIRFFGPPALLLDGPHRF